ncbi:MAG: ImmA/IrrE family metallo-endopeptidase [Coleofasciculaceae cyanobacterium RL_1_1]|nr:ImmA/IrrE family metallo-endopeptidase [Coleofasciculaceae cyanobacterium RL_1_1]
MQEIEKFARLLLKRHNLEPPYDLLSLAQYYANVNFIQFPSEVGQVDGVTLGIGEQSRPTILINSSSNKPEKRKRFTLAHELGHIFIPWHTGRSISNFKTATDTNSEYGLMEREANYFAAELLLPSTWVAKKYQESECFASFVEDIHHAAQTTAKPTLIKVHSVVNIPIISCEMRFGFIEKIYRSSDKVPTRELEGKTEEEVDSLVKTSSHRGLFSLDGRPYKYFEFCTLRCPDIREDLRSWREILDFILNEVGISESERTLKIQSVNGVLGAKFNDVQHLAYDQAFSEIMRAYDGLSHHHNVASHRLFPQYVTKRIYELKERRSSKKKAS